MGSLGEKQHDHEAKLATIDVSPLLSATSSSDSRNAALEALQHACTTDGFFVVTGHGIPLDLQREVLANAKTFFDLPLEQKQEVSTSKAYGMAFRGYEQMNAQAIEVGGHPDLKEGFIVGSEIPRTDPRAGEFLLGPNQWPSALKDKEFEKPLMEYLAKASALLEGLLRALSPIVSQYYSKQKVEELMANGESTLRLLHYPPKNPDVENQFGAAAHADLSCLTILLQQNGVTGLEVWSESKEVWIPAPAIENALVVNCGNVLQTWTGGYFKSARHRVVNGTSHHRYSAPLFYYGNLDAEFTPSEITQSSLPSQGRKGLVLDKTTTVGKYALAVIQAVQRGEL